MLFRSVREVVKQARERFTDFTISTDVIVGFPSETKEDFEKTVELVNEIHPDMVNLSKYSARPGTEAAEWDQIDASEVKRRSKVIFDLINSISLENNQRWIGWKGKVLFDEETNEGIKGRNFAYKPVVIKEEIKIGQTHIVEIVDATTRSILGKIAS